MKLTIFSSTFFIRASSLATVFLSATSVTHTSTFAQAPFWEERQGSHSVLINLPSFAPIVENVDKTIVNVSGSADSKPPQDKDNPQNRRRGPQGPVDPFSNPEEFFERFFGQPFGDRQPAPRRVLGSGFIISKDGYILTNNHVVEGTDKIEISLLGESQSSKPAKKFSAKLVGSDPATDVALLKVDTGFDLPVLPLGDSSKLQKGEWVMAFGNPFGLDHSVSAGIVSATGREISPNENRRFDEFVQTDAAINFGNSGGPLVNLRGEAIGINTAITAQGSGIGFAVPVNLVKDIIVQLKATGSVSRGYLGVAIGDVTEELKEAMGLAASKGVLVNDIVAGGPASKSDLRRGDIILKVNGQETNDAKSLQRTVAKIKPGSKVKMDILRDKKPLTLTIVLGNLSDSSPAAASAPKKSESEDRLGLIVGMASDGSGVQIHGVQSGSSADDAGLREGDLIRRIKGENVKTIADYERLVRGLKSKSNVLFDIQRGDTKSFIVVKVP